VAQASSDHSTVATVAEGRTSAKNLNDSFSHQFVVISLFTVGSLSFCFSVSRYAYAESVDDFLSLKFVPYIFMDERIREINELK